MVPQVLLLSPPLHWFHLALLSLSQCPPMVPWLLLLRIFWRGMLSRKLESLSQTLLEQLRLLYCLPMVAQHLRALAELLSLLLSPPLYWLHPRHSHSPLFLLADQLLHLWNLVNARLLALVLLSLGQCHSVLSNLL